MAQEMSCGDYRMKHRRITAQQRGKALGRKLSAISHGQLPWRRALTRPLISALSVIVIAGAVTGRIILGAAPAAGIISPTTYKCATEGSDASNRVQASGVMPDGSGDSFPAIQSAIDVAGQRGGGIVELPAGTFVTNGHLTLRNNVKLTGVGPATVIKAGPKFLGSRGPGGGYPLISTAGASHTTIANLTADQSGNTLDANVTGRLSSYDVEGRDSSNTVIDGVYTRNPFTYSIAMAGAIRFCIENSNVQASVSSRYDQLDGIHILDSSWGQVINNKVQSEDDGLVAHTIAAPVHDILYANNVVSGGPTADGMQLAVGDFPIYNIAIKNNEFYGSLFGVRTGYYSAQKGAVHNISIGDNYFHDLAQDPVFPAIRISDPDGQAPIRSVAVTDNRTCRAGQVAVQAGPGNVVNGTTGCRH
jgi:polygalacturonase